MLDKDQQSAVHCLNNHSIIIAGAGSGKTTTLLGKIEYMIENNINPRNILVISFTNETVNNFKSKCKYNVDVFTFHKCALNFLESSFDICEDDLLDIIIDEYLNNLSDHIKKKIYRLYNKIWQRYSRKKYNDFINKNDYSSLKKILRGIIRIVKTNDININKLNQRLYSRKEIFYLYLTSKIIKEYDNTLNENNMIDFDDIITIATNKLNLGVIHHSYKYILVDEYQDISKLRLNFLKSLVKSNNSVLTVVGDDWQSIYGFSGSDISLFYNFDKEFENVSKFYIRNSYRCPQKIIDISTKFILKNKFQIKKNLIAVNNNSSTLKKIHNTSNHSLSRLLSKLDLINNTALIISRNNYDIYKYLDEKLIYENSHFKMNNEILVNVRFMSIHKSKGLEADIVIILNLSMNKDGLPNRKEIDIYGKLKNFKEPIKYAEERRLFYVAMTRCRKELYLFVDKNNPSVFINEV